MGGIFERGPKPGLTGDGVPLIIRLPPEPDSPPTGLTSGDSRSGIECSAR